MQYILSEEEYQRYQDALKDAEAARSDAAKLAEEASKFTLVKSELRSGINRILQFIICQI